MPLLKFIHRWFGVIAALFVILFALSGIVLNHRNFFSPVSVNRNWLPAEYRLGNWNYGSVKSATYINTDSLLLYGNIGTWLTDNDFSFFAPFNNGFKKGVDNRKTFSVLHTKAGNTYAGTLSGLYFLNNNSWQNLELPVTELLVRGLIMRGDTLCVLTRSHLIIGNDNPHEPSFRALQLPPPEDYQGRTSMFRALWLLHSGEILGLPGKILVDLMGLVLVILCLTGIIWFIAPELMRALKGKILARKKLARINRVSLRWHNSFGIAAAALLIITALTGMFLRPPLLIAIINTDIANLPGTVLDNPNPWHDKLRDIQYDKPGGNFIFSTSEGFFTSDSRLSGPLKRIPVEPPVSIMGINVFEQPSDGEFITASFSGAFKWIPGSNHAYNLITGQRVSAGRGMAHPFGNLPVSGYIRMADDSEYLFDYNAGVLPLRNAVPFAEMPEKIKKQTPLPLWNLSQEIHTGRFYSFILGKYYILFIPLAGLVILSIVISGVILWIRDYKRKKRIKKINHTTS